MRTSTLIAAAALVAAGAVPVLAGDYALSWAMSDPTGVTEYAIGSRVAGVDQAVEYTGSTATSRTVTRAATPGQVVEMYVAACSASACTGWGPGASLVAGAAPAGTVTATTATAVRVGPPALP